MISTMSVLGGLHQNCTEKLFKLKKPEKIKAVYPLTVKHKKCFTLEKTEG